MKHYIDITLLPDAEINLGFLWQKVYQQIHLMLVENKVAGQDSAIAVSFPLYGHKAFPLGSKLRLFGQTENHLADLKVGKWLSRLDDYVHIKGIKPVPDDVRKFVYFKRKQFKSPEKRRRELEKFAEKQAVDYSLEQEDVKRQLLANQTDFKTESTLPFINITSLSSEKDKQTAQQISFKLFLEKEEATGDSNDNAELFTCYGLSRREQDKKVAVPWFD